MCFSDGYILVWYAVITLLTLLFDVFPLVVDTSTKILKTYYSGSKYGFWNGNSETNRVLAIGKCVYLR